MKGMSRTMFRERVILVAHNIGGSRYICKTCSRIHVLFFFYMTVPILLQAFYYPGKVVKRKITAVNGSIIVFSFMDVFLRFSFFSFEQ